MVMVFCAVFAGAFYSITAMRVRYVLHVNSQMAAWLVYL